MPRAALYSRLSRAKEDKLATVAVQEKNLRTDAKRRGLEVVAAFADDGISAWSGKERPGFLALLDAIKRREVDVVMAVRMDRFSRRNGETDALLYLCEKSGVTLIADGQEIDPAESPMAKAMAQIGGVLGELESSIKSGRVRAAKDEGARLGRYGGGPRPFGFEPDGVTIRQDEADLVRELFRRLGEREGLRSIALDWQERGIRNGNGNAYRPADLRQIVKRPRYAGLRVHRGEVVGKADWPALVTPEEQRAALHSIKSRPRPRSGPERRSRLLSGLMYCSECGHKLRVHQYADDRRPPRYICAEFDCCKASVRADFAETEVVDQFLAVLTEPETLEALARHREARPDLAGLLDETQALDTEIEELAAEFAAGKITRGEWRVIRDGLTERRDALDREFRQAEIPEAFDLDPRAVLKSWKTLDTDRRHGYLATLIERVTVVPLRSGPKFSPDRLKISWRV